MENEHPTPSDNFRLFPSRRIPACAWGTSKGLLRYEADAKGAAAGKDAEVCSSCHFAGQNCSGRKKRFRKKSTLEHAVNAFTIFRIKANFRS